MNFGTNNRQKGIKLSALQMSPIGIGIGWHQIKLLWSNWKKKVHVASAKSISIRQEIRLYLRALLCGVSLEHAISVFKDSFPYLIQAERV